MEQWKNGLYLKPIYRKYNIRNNNKKIKIRSIQKMNSWKRKRNRLLNFILFVCCIHKIVSIFGAYRIYYVLWFVVLLYFTIFRIYAIIYESFLFAKDSFYEKTTTRIDWIPQIPSLQPFPHVLLALVVLFYSLLSHLLCVVEFFVPGRKRMISLSDY